MTEERAKEWLQCVEVGGKELIQYLVDSHLEELDFISNYHTSYFEKHQSGLTSTMISHVKLSRQVHMH